ncbi:MAG: hypothetical protein AAGN46_18520, partial [Acidobacteriota bacterium]
MLTPAVFGERAEPFPDESVVPTDAPRDPVRRDITRWPQPAARAYLLDAWSGTRGDPSGQRRLALRLSARRALWEACPATLGDSRRILRAILSGRPASEGRRLELLYLLTFCGQGAGEGLAEIEADPTFLATLGQPSGRGTRDLLMRALETLAAGVGPKQAGLGSSHRRAAHRAFVDPLGFAMLCVEEGRRLVEDEVFSRRLHHTEASRQGSSNAADSLHELLVILDDPFLAAFDPLALADCLAAAELALVDAHRGFGQAAAAARALARAGRQLRRGTGGEELRARWHAAGAEQEAVAGRRAQALERSAAGDQALRFVRQPDRRAEALFEHARLLRRLGGDPARSGRLCDLALNLLGQLPPTVHPRLRLRLLHELAGSEVDLMQRRLGTDAMVARFVPRREIDGALTSALAHAARRLVGEHRALDRARIHL